jgi:hypothetical protein
VGAWSATDLDLVDMIDMDRIYLFIAIDIQAVKSKIRFTTSLLYVWHRGHIQPLQQHLDHSYSSAGIVILKICMRSILEFNLLYKTEMTIC